MIRPCFLVIDREFSGSISTRKLVIETAKFNVLTAYSGREAIDTLKAFPTVDGAVLDAGIRDMPCLDLVAGLRAVKPGLTIVAVSSPGADACDGADYHLETFDPKRLLALLQDLVPQQTAEIANRNDALQSAEARE